jgi:uncharacterized membrane protein YgcG
MDPEPPKIDPPEDDEPEYSKEHPYAKGFNNLMDAVANVLEKEKVVEAVGNWVNSHSEDIKKKPSVQLFNYGFSLIFSLVIFGGICVMAWYDKLPKEATATLLGSLIGYWFGRSQAGKEH